MARLDEHGIAPERLRPLRRNEFDKLVELGLFDEDERLELLHGQLVLMNPPGPEHASFVNRFNRALTWLLGERAVPGACREKCLSGRRSAFGPMWRYGHEPGTVRLLMADCLAYTG